MFKREHDARALGRGIQARARTGCSGVDGWAAKNRKPAQSQQESKRGIDPMNDRLNNLYKEKITSSGETLPPNWDRQECKAQELMEARGAMEILAALVTGEAKGEKRDRSR